MGGKVKKVSFGDDHSKYWVIFPTPIKWIRLLIPSLFHGLHALCIRRSWLRSEKASSSGFHCHICWNGQEIGEEEATSFLLCLTHVKILIVLISQAPTILTTPADSVLLVVLPPTRQPCAKTESHNPHGDIGNPHVHVLLSLTNELPIGQKLGQSLMRGTCVVVGEYNL